METQNTKQPKQKTRGLLRRFVSYYRPYRGLMAADIGASFLMSVFDLVYPMMTRRIINDIVPNRNMRLLVVFVGALLAIYVVKLGLNYFVQYYGHVIGVRMQSDMRRDVFGHLQKLPFSYFDQNKSGALMSRIVNDLQDSAELAHHGPEYFFLSVMMIAGSFVILCTINLTLTLIIFAFLPVFVVIMLVMQRRMERGYTESRKRTADINAELQNSISGIRVAKAFDNERGEVGRFVETLDDYKSARTMAYKAMGQFYSSMYFFIDLMYLVVLAAGGVYFFYGRIDAGDYAAYFLYVSSFITPIRRLMQFFEMYEDGKTGFKRFVEILDTPPELDSPGARDADVLEGDIVFSNVSFRYDNDQEVLRDLNITIQNGKKVALVGPSGGGKTTLCHLLPRFYDIDAGAITIGGVNIEDYTRSSLRRHIGIVQQEVFLFTGTIADNIGYAHPGITKREIEQAARRARIHDYIMTLDDGYDTYVGERGVRLSGGQRQRIAIARIFLKDPDILILDEATSALDNVTEQMLSEELDELCRGRTSIVVADRLCTVKTADEIIVLTGEGVAEQGAHDQLLAQGGLYAELYKTQFN